MRSGLEHDNLKLSQKFICNPKSNNIS